MKYIIEEDNNGIQFPIIFPDYLSHGDIDELFEYCQPISAGFCEIQNNQIVCYGQSVTLNLKCLNNDEDLIRKAFTK